jgi:hypothetical protein
MAVFFFLLFLLSPFIWIASLIIAAFWYGTRE